MAENPSPQVFSIVVSDVLKNVVEHAPAEGSADDPLGFPGA
jgi:hypothetical protein